MTNPTKTTVRMFDGQGWDTYAVGSKKHRAAEARRAEFDRKKEAKQRWNAQAAAWARENGVVPNGLAWDMIRECVAVSELSIADLKAANAEDGLTFIPLGKAAKKAASKPAKKAAVKAKATATKKVAEVKKPSLTTLRTMLKEHKAAGLIQRGLSAKEAIAAGLMDEFGRVTSVTEPVAEVEFDEFDLDVSDEEALADLAEAEADFTAERKTRKSRRSAGRKAYEARVAAGKVARVNGRFVKASEVTEDVAEEARSSKKALFWADLSDAGLSEAEIAAAWKIRSNA